MTEKKFAPLFERLVVKPNRYYDNMEGNSRFLLFLGVFICLYIAPTLGAMYFCPVLHDCPAMAGLFGILLMLAWRVSYLHRPEKRHKSS